MAVTDMVSEVRQQIDERMKELRPMVDEYERLDQVVKALDSASSNGPSEPLRRGRSRRRGITRASIPEARKNNEAGKRKRLPRAERLAQAHEVLQRGPKVTGRALGEQLGVSANYAGLLLAEIRKQPH